MNQEEMNKPVRSKSKKQAAPAIIIQSVLGGEITVKEILSRISEQTGDQAVTSVYIKAEENRAYYVAGDEGGCIELWQ